MIDSRKNLNLYLPQNENSFSDELDLMGIPTVQLQLEQLSTSLFRNIATLVEHIPIMFKHKRSKYATIFTMIFLFSLEKNYFKHTLAVIQPTFQLYMYEPTKHCRISFLVLM